VLALCADHGSLEARFEQLEAIIEAQRAQLQLDERRIHQLEEQGRRLDAPATNSLNVTGLKAELDTFKATIELDVDTKFNATADASKDMGKAMDHIYLILCGALVMFMQAGFAMVEAGCCRSKNVQNILLKNLTDVCVGTLGWWAFGCAFAYGNPDEDGDGYMDNEFIGTKHFFGSGYLETDDDGMQKPAGGMMLNWYFQWAFCSAAATIVSGGVAERVKFPGFVV